MVWACRRLPVWLLAAALGVAPAPGQDDRLGDARVSPVRLSDPDYSIEVTEAAANKLLGRFAAIDSQRTDVQSRLKSLSVSVDGETVKVKGKANVPLFGALDFDLSGHFELSEPNVFAYRFKTYHFSKQVGGVPIPLTLTKPVLLSLFGLFTRNKKLTEYLDLDASFTVSVPLLPTSWKKVYFRLKPKALPVLANLQVLHMGKSGRYIVLEGTLR